MTKDEALAFDLALEALTPFSTPNWAGTGVDKANEAITAIKQARSAPVQEPVAFKIYKPTPPRGAIPDIRDAELPWVYDQDPSSGNVASMWVTPVKATPPVQEPVAWRYRGILHDFDPSDWAEGPVTPLYTTPPAAQPAYTKEDLDRAFSAGLVEGEKLAFELPAAQRTWVGLTEPERLACYDLNPARFASAIEAKLKEKNT